MMRGHRTYIDSRISLKQPRILVILRGHRERILGDAFQARAATPSGLSRSASSCQHRIAIAGSRK
jgi:hypothetical protein